MDSPNEKLALGLQRLAKAGSDPDLLGLALQSIHGALEDAFRRQLASDPHVPEAQRAEMLDPKRVQWKALLDAMTLYCDLSLADAESIGRWNTTRNRVAHGGRFSGTHAELDAYAALAQRLLGYTPPGKLPPAPAPPSVAPAHSRAPSPPPEARARPASPPSARAPEIPRAVRPAATAPTRSGPGWLVIVAMVGLLGTLALVALVRSFTDRPVAAEAPAATATLLLTPAPGPTTPPATQRAAIVQAVPDLRVRAGPSLDSATLFFAANGARLIIVGGPVEADAHRWWQVELEGRQGWCAGEFLQFEE